MATTMWVIHRDVYEKKQVNIESVSHVEGSVLEHEFRLRDDDKNVYYKGKCNNDSSFAPLDDYGIGAAGCTEIQYRNKETKKWETL
jgi:uncharacterized protein YxjI